MELNYEFLKGNVVMIEVIKEINVGEFDAYFEDQPNNSNIFIDDEENIIINKGSNGQLNVQPHNNWYELKIEGLPPFDVALDDNELGEFFKAVSVVGKNKHFV